MLNTLLVVLAVTIPPPTQNFIVDQAQLLTPDETSELEAMFLNVKYSHKVNFGLLTLSSLDDDPKSVAVRTINFWQMTPNSVLILVSTNPRKIYLQPGDNLSSQFDYAKSIDIVRLRAVPLLREGKAGKGIISGFEAARKTLTKEPTATVFTDFDEKVKNDNILKWSLIVASFLLLISLFFFFRAKNKEKSFRSMFFEEDEDVVHNWSQNRTQTRNRSNNTTTVVNNTTSGGGFVEGMIVGEMLHNHHNSNSYTPPRYSPPSFSGSSYNNDSSSSSNYGGGGSDWGSSGGSDSGGGGGGGSDW